MLGLKQWDIWPQKHTESSRGEKNAEWLCKKKKKSWTIYLLKTYFGGLLEATPGQSLPLIFEIIHSENPLPQG